MTAYAKDTRVPVEQSRAEIERTIQRFGASGFAYMSQEDKVIIAFRSRDRNVRFDLPIPVRAPTKQSLEKQHRQRWRALLLAIKAKLSSVESGIETFEEAFYAHIVMPDGKTVYEHTRERIARIYGGETNVPLLPPPSASA
jgi:hypothetical protein